MSGSVPRPDAYVALDLEATGLSPKTDRPLEIGAVRYDSGFHRLGELGLVVDPGIPIPLAVQRLVGLRNADVRGAPTPEEGMAQLGDFCRDAALVTHGGAFDLAFCRAFLPEEFKQRLVFDTLELARILLPTLPSHSLPLLSALLAIEHSRPHRALSDAAATGELFQRLSLVAGGLPVDTLGAMREVSALAPGALAVFFESLVSGGAAVPPFTPPPEPGASPGHGLDAEGLPLDQAAATLLGPGGPLGAAEGYEYRAGQVEMARAVAQTLQRRRRLLVEAGTGSGKSLAYAVPLALWAARTGKRAVIATRTVPLQEQLMTSDLPEVMRLLPRPLSVAMLKGQSHYLSPRRWNRWLGETAGAHAADVEAVRFKLKVLVWLSQTQTGDRSELHLAASEQGLWRRVESDSGDCLGAGCTNRVKGRCFLGEARKAAAEAQLVVTNHALLLADSERDGEVLGAFSALVVDEAHQLEASATQQLGTALGAADLSRVLERLADAGAPEGVLDACHEAASRLFGDAKGFLVERLGGEGNGAVSLTPEIRADLRFAALMRSGRHAVGVLLRSVEALEAAGGGISRLDLGEPEPLETGERALLASALRRLASEVDGVVCRPEPGRVAWLELRAEQPELHDAPTGVADHLRERVFDQVEAAVLTSATLAVGGSFDFARTRVGIGGGADELLLASPFDYLEQALCILASDVPPYDDPGHDAVMAGLVSGLAERLGGRTLVLFTGYGPLKRVHQLIGSSLEPSGIALLGQGLDGTRRQILRSFLADHRSVILGTTSFWEGVDLPGDALRCVVIDKLPFPVPTDPLVRARSEECADPFGQYVLPLAVLRLKQGFGRLIRTRTDRGAVVLCDPRLHTRDYGPRFLAALPPAAVVREPAAHCPATVQAFVERGAVPEAVGQSNGWSSTATAFT